MQWAADVGDDDTVAYLISFYCGSHLRRCDVEPALIERGLQSAVRNHSAAHYVASLVRCRVKDEDWLRRFVEREMETIVSFARHRYDSDVESIRDFLQASPADV